MKRSAHIEHHIDIGAPASVIYKLTTDIEQWPSFVTTVTSVHRIDHGPLVVGSKALLNQPHQPVTEWTVREL